MARSTRGWTSEGPGPRSRRAGGANSPGIAVTGATLHERHAAGENAGGFSGRSCQDAEREVPVTTDQAEVLTVVREQRGAEAARAERDQDVVQQRRQLRSPALVPLFDCRHDLAGVDPLADQTRYFTGRCCESDPLAAPCPATPRSPGPRSPCAGPSGSPRCPSSR